MTEADVNFIGAQLARVLNEIANVRDDITVLSGITVRLEGAVNGLTLEMRGIHSQNRTSS